MIALFLIAAASATASQAPAKPQVQPAGPARSVIEAQLRSPPREADPRSLSAEEADVIYKRYLASIGQRPERAPESQSGAAP